MRGFVLELQMMSVAFVFWLSPRRSTSVRGALFILKERLIRREMQNPPDFARFVCQQFCDGEPLFADFEYDYPVLG